jgi:MFS family permease
MRRFSLRPTTITLTLLALMYFITYLDRVNVSTAAAGFKAEFGLTNAELGLVFSAFAYPYLLFQLIGGWVSDRFGTRTTLIVCGAIWAAATALMGAAEGFTSLLLIRLLLGLGEGATFPAATAVMSRWVAQAKRSFAQGLTHSAARVGNAAAPAVVVALMSAYSWRAVFFICGAISFSWVILWAATFTDNPADHARITSEELNALTVIPARTVDIPWGRLFKRMAPVTIVYFCYGWTLWLFLSWIPQYFLHNYQLRLSDSAIFSMGVFFAGVVGDLLGGVLSDWLYKVTGSLHLARSVMVAVCMFLALVWLAPLMFVHNVVVSVACLSMGFFFAEMTIGPMWAVPMDIAPRLSGTASGMMNVGSALAAIVSPPIGGALIDATGNWNVPFVGSVVLMALGMVLALRMRPERPFELRAGQPVVFSQEFP